MHTVCSFFNFYLSFLILGIRKLLTAVDDLIVIRFAPCAFMVLAFFTDARRDILQPQSAPTGKQFQLTRLMRGVTADEIKITGTIEFQLTRLMRGVTSRTRWMKFSSTISTHTPHARRDTVTKS